MKINNYNRRYWPVLIIFITLGAYNSTFGLLAVACMIAPVLTAFFKGRMWCGRFCPRGSFFDHVLARLGDRNRRIPQLLKKTWMRWIIFISLMTYMGFNLYIAEKSIYGIGAVLFKMVIITTVFGVLLGYLFAPRSWCKICPMGTLAMIAGRGAKVPLVIKSSECRLCGICARNCPLEIPVHSFRDVGIVEDPDCLKCGVCISSCPVTALKLEDKNESRGAVEIYS